MFSVVLRRDHLGLAILKYVGCCFSALCETLMGKMSGENNPNWRGGRSFEPYCVKFNEEFKEYIRAKFGRVCFLCGKTEADNGRKLNIHHVDYNKGCGCGETEEEQKQENEKCQFVPLCNVCHSKTHHNRDKWVKFFMDKLRNKLNGWYI